VDESGKLPEVGAGDVPESWKIQDATLVIAGERDYRVPYTQSLEFFSALQSKRAFQASSFSDEGHWVLKPQNAQFWYKTFLDWLLCT